MPRRIHTRNERRQGGRLQDLKKGEKVMAGDDKESFVKKLIILIVLVGVLVFIVLPRFTAKPKIKSPRGSAPAQGSDLARRPSLDPNFKKLPPEIQEMILESRPKTQGDK